MLLPLKCSFYNHFTLLPILHKQLKGQKKWAYGVLDIFLDINHNLYMFLDL